VRYVYVTSYLSYECYDLCNTDALIILWDHVEPLIRVTIANLSFSSEFSKNLTFKMAPKCMKHDRMPVPPLAPYASLQMVAGSDSNFLSVGVSQCMSLIWFPLTRYSVLTEQLFWKGNIIIVPHCVRQNIFYFRKFNVITYFPPTARMYLNPRRTSRSPNRKCLLGWDV
jgi:hypothetical protein